jgi:hypothetical protein
MKKVALVAGAAVVAAAAIWLVLDRRAEAAPFNYARYRAAILPRLEQAMLLGTRGDPEARDRALAGRRPVLPEHTPSAAEFAGDARPGARSFRAASDAVIDLNRALAEEKAAKKGLTLEEIRETNYLAMIILRSMQWGLAEEIVGREITPEDQQWAQDRMAAVNRELNGELRRMVGEGTPVEERMQAIRDATQEYITGYCAAFGMTEEQFDQLLAVSPFGEEDAPEEPLPPEPKGVPLGGRGP